MCDLKNTANKLLVLILEPTLLVHLQEICPLELITANLMNQPKLAGPWDEKLLSDNFHPPIPRDQNNFINSLIQLF